MFDRCCKVYGKARRKIFPCFLIVCMILSVSCSSMAGSETVVEEENVVFSPISEPQNIIVPAEKEYVTVLPEPEVERPSEESKTDVVESDAEEIESSQDTEEPFSETDSDAAVESAGEPEVIEQPEEVVASLVELTEVPITVSEPFSEPGETVTDVDQGVTEKLALTEEVEVVEVAATGTRPYESETEESLPDEPDEAIYVFSDISDAEIPVVAAETAFPEESVVPEPEPVVSVSADNPADNPTISQDGTTKTSMILWIVAGILGVVVFFLYLYIILSSVKRKKNKPDTESEPEPEPNTDEVFSESAADVQEPEIPLEEEIAVDAEDSPDLSEEFSGFTEEPEPECKPAQILDLEAEFAAQAPDDEPESDVVPIYLGIDFGTSYSKLAYWIGQNDRGVIAKDGNYFIETSVFFNGKNICTYDAGSDYVRFRYFKYEMIPDTVGGSLFSNEMKGKIKGMSKCMFARNCSIFFIASLLEHCRKELMQRHNNIFFSVNMGVPISPNSKGKKDFEDILYCAFRLFDERKYSECMSFELLSELCTGYLTEHSGKALDDRYPLHLTPEVVAEADYLLQQQTYGTGIYIIVDIGGGTADFAFIQKCAGTQFGAYDIVWYSIVPHGIETMKTNKRYTTCLSESYHRFLLDASILKEGKKMTATYLLFGGGAANETPRGVIRGIMQQYKNLAFKYVLSGDSRDFPEHYQVGSLNLSDNDKKRLIIACQLSNPNRPSIAINPPTIEDMEELRKAQSKAKKNPVDYHSSLEERQRELYGN